MSDSQNHEITKYDAMRTAIEVAHSVDEVKDIRDRAEALRTYAKQSRMGVEDINRVTEIKLRAERRAGVLLAELERGKGNQWSVEETSEVSSTSEYKQTLKENGIPQTTSNKWQTIANIPAPVFENHVSDIKDKNAELTTASVLKLAKDISKREKKQKSVPEYVAPDADRCRLILGRAEDVPEIESGTIDIVITSPPYNLEADNWPMGGEGRESRNGIGYDRHDDAMGQADYEQWQVSVLAEMYRVCKPGASLFYNHKVRTVDGEMIHPMRWLLAEGNPWVLRQEIIWDRKSTHNHSATLFWPIDERIYWLTKGKPTIRAESIGKPTIWQAFGPIPSTWHPAPFTDKLPGMLLDAVGVDDSVTVLDPFMGSGATLRASLVRGCWAVGVDISEEYITRAAREEGWHFGPVT